MAFTTGDQNWRRKTLLTGGILGLTAGILLVITLLTAAVTAPLSPMIAFVAVILGVVVPVASFVAATSVAV